MAHEEPEENITHMDAWLYKAAAEGNIEVFNNHPELQLESLKTPNHDTLLHLNLATPEYYVSFNTGFLWSMDTTPPVYLFFRSCFGIYINKRNSKKRSNFIEQILGRCPSLLLQTNAKGQTPLHVAAWHGHSAIVKLLIRSCANARDGDLEQLGPDQENAVREMLRIRDKESNTALHEAAACGNVEVVKALLEFEDPDFPYSDNKKQETPLYIAARRGGTRRRGSGRLLTLLLDKWKSAGHGGPHGRTALHAAAMAGDAEAISVILKKKGNLTKERDEDGHTPLHYAAHLGCNSVVEVLLKWDVSAAYIGDKKRGMTPLLMAARQGNFGIVRRILSLCPDCCEKVDNKGFNLLHYLAFRFSSTSFGHYFINRGRRENLYASFRNLRRLEGAFGMTPQEVYNALLFEKHDHKQEQIKEFLEEIQNDQVAGVPVHRFPIQNISTENLEKTRDAHLVVAALIATVAFTAAITVPGGLKSEKGPEQGTPFLIDEAAFKAFVVTNALAFLFSVSALTAHFGVLDNLLSGFYFFRHTLSYRTRAVSEILGYATLAMMIAFSTGSYVILKSSNILAPFSTEICLAFLLCMVLILASSLHK